MHESQLSTDEIKTSESSAYTTISCVSDCCDEFEVTEYQEELQLYSGKYITYDEIMQLVDKNYIAYSLFYEIDSRDNQVQNSIFTVNMNDYKNYNSFYSFINSIYTADTVDELFNNFMGHGKSFWEEGGLFLVDTNVVTSSATTNLYSEFDEVEVVSENENECKIIYWFHTPRKIYVDGEIINKPFGLTISIINENGVWKLSEMIRPSWKPQNVVFKDTDTGTSETEKNN